MSDKLALVKALLRGIRVDEEQYGSLAKLLEQQRLCMIRRDCEALEAVNHNIEQHYADLSEQSLTRRTTLQQLGVTADHAGLQTVFSWLPAPQRTAAKAAWQQLETRAIRCKAYNEKNGELLIRQQEFARAFLGHEPDFIYHR